MLEQLQTPLVPHWTDQVCEEEKALLESRRYGDAATLLLFMTEKGKQVKFESQSVMQAQSGQVQGHIEMESDGMIQGRNSPSTKPTRDNEAPPDVDLGKAA